ncbi:MAG: hypothetical protein JXR97_03600 [Planctomycetes bacterium]|nr:hypothetical protein [Planctomycetota bacterium]
MVGIQTVGGFIGRLFGNNSVAQAYSPATRKAVGGESSRASGMDIVELSPHAPRPLDSREVEDVNSVANKFNSGETLSGAETEKLRQDRVFTALAVLAALSKGNGESPKWPGGFPEPTAAELDAAYRRLAQKMTNLDSVRNPEEMQQLREKVLDDFKGADFSVVVVNEFGE